MSQMRSRRASVADVARLAGVSVGTVSNVLNRPEAVSASTRAKVETAIGQLRFVRNGIARQLRSGTARTVGVILLDIRNPFFTEMARGIEDHLTADGHLLMLASSDDDPVREARYRALFEEHGVAGMLIVPTSADPGPLLALAERGMRIVLLDAPSPTRLIASVTVDDIAGGELAARHLLDQGYRTISFLNGAHGIRQCADRRMGVDRAVQAVGLDPGDVVSEIRLPALHAAAGDAAVERLAASRSGIPEAIFAVNDLVAIGAMRAIRRHGGSALLERTAIVGYDDIDVASELAVPLTSVRQPMYEMGLQAARLLLDTAQCDQIVFMPDLIVRASSVR